MIEIEADFDATVAEPFSPLPLLLPRTEASTSGWRSRRTLTCKATLPT